MASPVKKDVIIIGAGPSGSRLAFKLAGLGHNVLVLERQAAAGEENCCTGIISRQCLEEFDIDRGLVLRPASAARLVAPSGQVLRFWRDDEVAFILDRPALDKALAERAQAAGAEYRFGQNVVEVAVEPGGVRVGTIGGRVRDTFEAEMAALATGFGSTLPVRLGLGRIDDVVLGAQARVEGIGAEETEIYFDRKLAPGGFAWLVPTQGGRGLAGLLTRRQPQAYLSRLLARLEAKGQIASQEARTDYAVVPLRPLPRTVGERLLVLGEAAGQVKPTTAGGIYYGLLCADIAADSLRQAFQTGDFSAAGLSDYERRWRARLGKELKDDRRLLHLYRMLGNGQLDWAFRLMRRRRLPDFVAGLEVLPFDWHGGIARRLLKYLVTPGLDKARRM